LSPKLVERLVDCSLGRRNVSLVLVDAASFGAGEKRRFPELLRLQAAGVAIAVLRSGDDLATVLAAPAPVREAAHG
jgi:hypothetical protein